MKAVIFAGGVGTRLWPLSRKSSPKQFEKVIGDKSTLQLAIERLLPIFSWNDIYVSTGKTYVNLVKNQLPLLPTKNIIGEPEMRDVGPAVGLITAILTRESPKTPLVILWSDHIVGKEDLFRDILIQSGKYIASNTKKIIFIGQEPRFPSQNLGWIGFGDLRQKIGKYNLYNFKSFHYRPDLNLATNYFKSGHYAWNLGYFVTTPQFLWEQYNLYAKEMSQNLKTIQKSWNTRSFDMVLKKIYPKLERISFDNAILEKIDPKTAYVISENIAWSDVGAWEALKEALQKNPTENVTSGRVLINDCQDNLVYNYTKQLVVTLDLKSLLIINTNDVLLICHKDSVPKIKKLVEGFSGTENEHLT